MSHAEEYVSLKPSDAVKGGGTIEEGRYKITSAEFILFDYGGTVVPAAPSLAVGFTNADGILGTQCYSAGSARNLEPSASGKRLRRASGSSTSGLNDSSNCFLFLRSLANAGFSEELLAGDIDVIIGLDVDIIHEQVKERDFKDRKVAARSIPVVGKIHGTAKATTAKAAKAAAKSNGSPATLEPKAQAVLVDVLKAEGPEMQKKDISTAVFKRVQTDPDRSAILQLIVQDSFLKGLVDAGILYDAERGAVMYVGG